MSITTLGPDGPGTALQAPFPDPPRHLDEANNFRHLAKTGGAHYLAVHFGEPDTTVIDGKLYVSPYLVSNIKGLRAPDMLIAFGANPEACARRNACVIAEQGKPPDFVLEVASRSTGYIDVAEKPADYAALGIPEYWRFDETGEHYGVRLAGDRLVEDRYEPIEITDLPDGGLDGYSGVLNLNLRWEEGQLTWYVPGTGMTIMSLAKMQRIMEEERQGRLEAEHKAETARTARLEAERQAEAARQARLEVEHQAEVERQAWLEAERIKKERIRQLEDRLDRSRP